MGPGPSENTRSKTKAVSSSASSALSSAPSSASSSLSSRLVAMSPTTPSTPHIEQLSADVPHLDSEGTNWAIFEARFQDAMETACQWGHFDGSEPCPVPKDIANPMDTEIEAARHWDRNNQIT